MKEYPALTTERLLLRGFTLNDAKEVQKLAGDRDVASSTLNIPHPYPDRAAEEWISTHREKFEKGSGVVFAITTKDSPHELVGAISLEIEILHQRAELGYWVGRPYWNKGYATEAAKALLKYGFEELTLNRIYSNHFTRNPASGRVMQKIGMKYEGCLHEHIKKWDVFEDVEMYGVLKKEYKAAKD